MRYFLLDRILRLERNKQISAVKNVALSEDIYTDHFFGFPVMPGALLIESLAQAGTALLEVSAEFKKKALLILVDGAKFRFLVKPGDQLVLNMEILSLNSDSAQLDGAIRVLERVAMTGRLTFGLKDMDQVVPAKNRFLMESIYEIWLRETELVGFGDPQNEE